MPKFNQEETYQLNRLNTRNETDYVSLQTKAQDQMTSWVNSAKHTKRKSYSSLNFSKRLKKEHSHRYSMMPLSLQNQNLTKMPPKKKTRGQYL